MNDAAVMTTSASSVASRADSGAARRGDPGRRAGRVGEGRCPIGVAVVDRELHARQDVPEHVQVAVTLHPGPDDRRARRAASDRPRATGPNRASATPDTAAVRCAVIGPPSRIARGCPVRGSLRITTAWIAGRPLARFSGKPATHLIPSRSRAGGVAQGGRHGMGERAGRARMDADLGWQLGVGDQRGHRPFREGQPLVDRWHRRADVGRREVARADGVHETASLGGDRGSCAAGSHSRRSIALAGTMPGVAPIDLATSLENLKLERDAIVLYDALAEIEKNQTRAEAFRRIASNERRHADVWATKLTELGATVPPARRPAAARPVHHVHRSRVRDPVGR